jgi:hypothetical protein
MFSRVKPIDQEQNYAILTSRNQQQLGVLCPVRLLRPNDILRTDELLRADSLLHSGRLRREHCLLRPAAEG